MRTARSSRIARWFPAAALVSAALAACGGQGSGSPESIREVIAVDPIPEDPFQLPEQPSFPDPLDPAQCDPTITVKSDGPALLVRDPAVLESFALERVLTQLLERIGDTSLTPLELLQRLFDTENDEASAVFADAVHCDSPANLAFKNSPSVDCPRVEGALAASSGLLTPGHADYFAPIALVNRFDLTTTIAESCGEYRIVYAKWSGRTDPNDRVFLIFEGALLNPWAGKPMACAPVAQLWKGLEDEADPAQRKARLEAFYFQGISAFSPVVDPAHFGLKASDDNTYGETRGQVRVSHHMQDPWEMREFRFTFAEAGGPPFVFVPVTVKNNPTPALFDADDPTPLGQSFRSSFLNENVQFLMSDELFRIRMRTENMFNLGSSAVLGEAQTNYTTLALASADDSFVNAIDAQLASSPNAPECPPDDPLTAESILRRASLQTCAGCHAPQQFLGPERKIGCGLVWPNTMGEVHIDEYGKLSPALTDALLPRRKAVMEIFLQACSWEDIINNLQPASLPDPF